MQVCYLNSRAEKKDFIKFIYKLYQGNPYYKDSLVPIIRDFLFSPDVYQKECVIRPLQIRKSGRPLAQCILIHAPNTDFIQAAFFESLLDQTESLKLIIKSAEEMTSKPGCQKIVFGLNGHLQYGVGFLANHFDKAASFDSPYTPPYYIDQLRKLGLREKTLSSYFFTIDDKSYNQKMLQKIQQNFSVRFMNKKTFKKDMLIFGKLSNRCLKDTYLYQEKNPYSLYQLLTKMKIMLKNENLIFLMHKGKEVGFLFWHPDFNQILPGGRHNSLFSIFWRSILLRKKITRCKLNAIGVLPEHQNQGGVLLLLETMRRQLKGRFCEGETNFVWDSNLKSRVLNRRRADKVLKRYSVFEKKLN